MKLMESLLMKILLVHVPKFYSIPSRLMTTIALHHTLTQIDPEVIFHNNINSHMGLNRNYHLENTFMI